MKKSLLALAIAALATSSAASAATVYDKDGTSLDVYGRVQGVVYSKTTQDTANADDNTIVASGRLGFDMRTQLTPSIAGFAKLEWDVADGQGHQDGFAARYAWVGADFGQYGQIKVGTFEDAIKYVLNTTDIFDDWGCVGQAGNDDKRDGMVMYSWSGYGFDANVSYQASQKGQLVDGAYFTAVTDANNALVRGPEALDIENAFAVSLGYTSPDVLFGPIAVRAGYGYAKFTDHGYETAKNFHIPDLPNTVTPTPMQTGIGVYDNYKQYAVSLSWGTLAQGPYVAALYQTRDFSLRNVGNSDIENSYSVDGVEFVVGYGFANGVAIRTGYEWQQVDFDVKGIPEYSAQTVPVYVNYQINPNFNVWAEARFDVGTDDDNLETDPNGKNFKDITGANFAEHVYSVGARFTF